MSYWDSSALMKLFVEEADSLKFRQHAQRAKTIVTASLAEFELQVAFRRREADGALPGGQASLLLEEWERFVTTRDVDLPALPGTRFRS